MQTRAGLYRPRFVLGFALMTAIGTLARGETGTVRMATFLWIVDGDLWMRIGHSYRWDEFFDLDFLFTTCPPTIDQFVFGVHQKIFVDRSSEHFAIFLPLLFLSSIYVNKPLTVDS